MFVAVLVFVVVVVVIVVVVFDVFVVVVIIIVIVIVIVIVIIIVIVIVIVIVWMRTLYWLAKTGDQVQAALHYRIGRKQGITGHSPGFGEKKGFIRIWKT